MHVQLFKFISSYIYAKMIEIVQDLTVIAKCTLARFMHKSQSAAQVECAHKPISGDVDNFIIICVEFFHDYKDTNIIQIG